MENIPETLKSALEKQRERHFLLRLETNLVTFISQIAKHSHKSSHKSNRFLIDSHLLTNSYLRLLAHQLCKYHELQHWNTTTCDIMVSPIDGLDYTLLLEQLNNNVKPRLSDYLNSLMVSVRGEKMGVASNDDTFTKEKAPVFKPRKMLTRHDSDLSSGVSNSSKDALDSCDTETVATITTEDTEVSRKGADIEGDRAAKEALYMKMRQEIFSAEEDDVDEKEDADEDEEEGVTGTNRNINDSQSTGVYGDTFGGWYDYGYPPYPPQGTANPQMMGNVPMMQAASPNQAPMACPAPLPGMYVPMMMPNYYNGGYFVPSYNAGYGISYDKETARRLLNNPYIIIPNDSHTNSGNSHKKKYHNYAKTNRPHKPTNQYHKNKKNGGSNVNGTIHTEDTATSIQNK